MPQTTNSNEGLLTRLRTAITNAGGSLPTVPEPSNVQDYLFSLLDSINTAIASALGVKEVTFEALTATQAVDRVFFVANRAYEVTIVRYIHATAGNDASAVNVQLTKDTGTNAPGAGTALLTNNTNAGFNCKGTANTVQTGTLTATTASLRLAAGDRLAAKFAGTRTALAGVAMTVTLKPI